MAGIIYCVRSRDTCTLRFLGFPKLSIHWVSESSQLYCGAQMLSISRGIRGRAHMHLYSHPLPDSCCTQHTSHMDHSAEEGKRQTHEAFVSKAGAHLATLSPTSPTQVAESYPSHVFQSSYLALPCCQ